MARGDGRIYQRGSRWWISYYVGGRNVRKPGGDTEAKARKKLQREVGLIRTGERVDPYEDRVTVAQLLDALVADAALRGSKSGDTKVPFYGHEKPIREFFGARKAIAVSTALVQEYQEQRLDAHKSRGTVNREVGVLRQAYRLAKRTETLRRVPYFPMLKEGSPRQGFAEPEQVEAIAKAMPEPLADLVRFAFMTSWRRGEVRGLTWSMVDRNAGEIRLPTSKNGRGRVIPLTGELAALVERRWKARTFGCDFVFHENGVPVGDFRKAWASACVEAGVGEKDEAGNYKGLLFHDLRRSGIRVLVRAGVPQSVVMSISGHRTISTFLRYDITSGKDQAAALEAAQAYRESKNRDKTGTK